MAGKRAALWDFVDTLAACETQDAVKAKFVAAMADLGFARVCMVSEVDPLKPGPRGVSIFHDIEDWMAHYSAEGYYRGDPIHAQARRSATPFSWNEQQFRDGLAPTQLRMLDEMDEARLGYGVIIPLVFQGELPAACGLMTDGHDDVGLDNYRLAHSMVVFAHAAACRALTSVASGEAAPKLTARERECLLLAARGKSDWEIGRLLNLSERTIHHAIERAKRRLGVTTRVQAVVRAIHLGEITTNDAAN